MVNLRAILFVAVAAVGHAQSISLAAGNWTAKNVIAEAVTYKGRKALRVRELAPPPGQTVTEDRLVVLKGAPFRDGVIELEISGEPGPGSAGDARGFVGLAYRVASDLSKFECFYLRPTNGRADDQVRRNHSAQYFAFPEFPWMRLRTESPSKYESYVDLVPGEWTKVKIEVHGASGRLQVNGNTQPTLVVNDLKLAGSEGAIALWLGPGTVAHFTDLRRSGQ